VPGLVDALLRVGEGVELALEVVLGPVPQFLGNRTQDH